MGMGKFADDGLGCGVLGALVGSLFEEANFQALIRSSNSIAFSGTKRTDHTVSRTSKLATASNSMGSTGTYNSSTVRRFPLVLANVNEVSGMNRTTRTVASRRVLLEI